jgi:hypothetical protein
MGKLLDRTLIVNILFIFIIVGIFLFPTIHLSFSFPHFQLTDILLPFVTLFIPLEFVKRYSKKIIFLTFLPLLMVFISILFNLNKFSYNDLFEFYKILKIIIYILFFCSNFFEKRFINNTINFIFVGVFVFNIFQYFNFFDFNNTLELLYADYKHLIFFGKNTLGQPDTRRLLGSFGNPNNNSIGISFFFFYYLFSERSNKFIKYLFINLSLLLILASQSRTGFYSLTLIFVYYVFVQCKSFYKKLMYIGFYILCFVFVSKLQEFETNISVSDSKISTKVTVKPHIATNHISDKHTLLNGETAVLGANSKSSTIVTDKSHVVANQMNEKHIITNSKKEVSGTKYLSSVDFEDMDQNTSINSRLEIWKLLFNMIKEKPILGHGPQKNFFYEKHLYPENEYILNFWRYGLIGLIVYILFYTIPIIGVFKKDKNTKDPNFYFLILLSITAITNLPLSEPRISILVAMSFGFLLNKYYITNEKKITFS